MPKSAVRPHSSFHPQPSEAEKAFLALQPEIDAFDGVPQRSSVDVQAAAAIAHSVVLRDQEPSRIERFECLAEVELYDFVLPERVRQLALATWFTRQRQLGLMALSSDASVPLEVLRNAQLQRRTMLKVLDHWFDDDPALTAEVAAIREGVGYQDLANDLEALAEIYLRPAILLVIQGDRKHYRNTDVSTARALAKSIFNGLGLARASEAKRWGVLCQRAWSLLLRDYDEHRCAGMFLFRRLEEVSETYPSLVSAVRRPPSPRSHDDDTGYDDQVDEAAAPNAEAVAS